MNIEILEKPKTNLKNEIKVKSNSDIVKLKEVQEIRNAFREHLLFVGLDNKNNIRNISVLAIGSTCNAIIDTKEIIRLALLSVSDRVVLVHNHPSKSLKPSESDIHITNITNQILKVFDIELLDHIIVTENDFISMQSIEKIDRNYENEELYSMSKGLLLEENAKLKQQIEELQQKRKAFEEEIEMGA